MSEKELKEYFNSYIGYNNKTLWNKIKNWDWRTKEDFRKSIWFEMVKF